MKTRVSRIRNRTEVELLAEFELVDGEVVATYHDADQRSLFAEEGLLFEGRTVTVADGAEFMRVLPLALSASSLLIIEL